MNSYTGTVHRVSKEQKNMGNKMKTREYCEKSKRKNSKEDERESKIELSSNEKKAGL